MKLNFYILFLLFAQTLFAATRPQDLLCSHFLENLTPHQSRLRSSFWKAAEPPPEEERGDSETIQAWHNRLLGKTEKFLTSLKVDHEDVDMGDGTKGIRVLARPEGNPLNVFVHNMEKWLGVEFIYAPAHLMKENGKFSRARYNKTKNTIYLSHEFVDGVHADESLHHELLHAAFNWFRANHVDSLFHGEIKSTDEDWDLWETESYERRMSFEELATMPVNLVLFAKGLERLNADGNWLAEDGLKFVKEVRRKAEILNGISAESWELIGNVRKAVRDGEEGSGIKFELKPLPPSKMGEVNVGWAILHWQHNKIRIPLVTDELIALVAQYESLDAGREKRALKKELTEHVLARLKSLEQIGKQLEDQTDHILNRFDAIIARVDDGRHPTPAQVTDVVKRLKEPRVMTLPYLNSLDGRPPTSGPGTKVPMPENDF